MKLIFVANTDWFLYNYRLAQAKYMRSRGYSVTLVSPPGPFVHHLLAEDFAWEAWQVSRQNLNPWQETNAIVRLANIFNRIKPDLVHAFTMKAVLYSGLALSGNNHAGLAAGITGRGYLFLSPDLRARITRPFASCLLRLAFQRRGIACIFENDVDQNDFIRRKIVNRENTFIIPGAGADTERFVPAPEPAGNPVVLFAGRLLIDKGLKELVEAGRILRSRGNTFRLVFAGDIDPGNPGSITENDLITWEKAGEIEWWGFQARIEETFHQSHILVLPTYYGEGVPTILMEAASAGLPIVATNLAGCESVVQHGRNGLIVPVHNSEALANALEQLINDPALREKMGREGRSRALTEFSHEVINQLTWDVYQKILPEPNL